MKRISLYFLGIFFLISCQGSNTTVTNNTDVFKDQASFLNYYNSLKLSEDFIALDTLSKVISKSQLLQKVASGEFFPIRQTSHGLLYYKLHKVNSPVKEMIWIQNLAEREYNNYQKEGTVLPGFHYVDFNGKRYDNKTTKGKIIVLNFWFIGCTACVKEMPELNKIVENYKNRNIVFLGVAFDKKDELKKFLNKVRFLYTIIPVSKDYVINTLGITSFPTQIIVNREGRIAKVFDNYQDIETVLKKIGL